MEETASKIFGYSYGSEESARSPVSIEELEALKTSTGITREDQTFLERAGEVLKDQTKQIVEHWRSGIIASIPNLARHSRTPSGEPLPAYLGNSNLRFQQWILDTCFRAYDQEWLNYQQEIAVRHTSLKKNLTDGFPSTAFVPFRDIVAFAAVMNQTIKPYLAKQGDSAEMVEKMHQAWCKSIQLQLALWAKAYMDNAARGLNEW